jgi:nucleoid DNA-binding protein
LPIFRTSGFYFAHPKEPKIEIEKILLLENKKDAKTNKSNYDFSHIAKNIIDEIFDKFDVDRDGLLSLDELQIFCQYSVEDVEEFLEKIKSTLDDQNQLNLKGFRNFLFHIVKLKGEKAIYSIFKKFGYYHIINYECRQFFMSFHTSEPFDVKLSDGVNNRLNAYAFELYLKHVGTIMNTSNNKYVNIIYDQTKDSCNVVLMLENKSDNEKKVTFEIESSGYTSLNGYKYKNVLKPKECKYLFAIAIDKNESKELSQQQSLLIRYHLICE